MSVVDRQSNQIKYHQLIFMNFDKIRDFGYIRFSQVRDSSAITNVKCVQVHTYIMFQIFVFSEGHIILLITN